MFRGQKYKENTRFQFVSYKVDTEAKAGSFKVVKKNKVEIPNVAKFKLEYDNKDVNMNTNNQVKPEIRKLDFSSRAKHGDQVKQILRDKKQAPFLTISHRLKLIQLASSAQFSSSKWGKVASDFNGHFNLTDSDSVSPALCQEKFTQVLQNAQHKTLNNMPLMEDERCILTLHRVNHNKTVYADQLNEIKTTIAFLQKNTQTEQILRTIEKLNSLEELILHSETKEGVQKPLADLKAITNDVQSLLNLENIDISIAEQST